MSRTHTSAEKPDTFLASVGRQITVLVGEVCPDAEQTGLLVGLSGGPDSVALLLAAHSWAKSTGNTLEAAHLNHALRGQDADDDAAFCRELCLKLGLTLHEHREDPRPVARQRGKGLEEASRHLRYRLFDGIMATNPQLKVLATGHHEDDQSETVVMRLFRGTGLDGLQGIHPVQGYLIRPMLTISRREILAWLEKIGQPWRLDHTNQSSDNVRARFRRELMPLVRDIFGPGSDRTPARLAQTLGPDVQLLESLTTEYLNKATISGVAEPSLAIPVLLDMPTGLSRRVLRSWLGSLNCPDLELIHVNAVLQWLSDGQSGTSLDLPGGVRLQRNFHNLSIRVENDAPPLLAATDYRIRVEISKVGPDPKAATDPVLADSAGPPWHLVCPDGCLVGNLRVRNLRAGDHLVPFGRQGTKKLSDLLRENKVPVAKRAQVMVVEDDQGILWVIGLTRAERTRLLPSSARTVTIFVIERSS